MSEDRKILLLEKTYELLKRQYDSSRDLNLLEEDIYYDDAGCDGECLMNDIAIELDIKENKLSQNQTEYGKTITFTKLAQYVFEFCMAKIIRDKEKSDPLTCDIHYLKKRTDEERAERLKAFQIWEGSRTDKNAVAVINEIADEIDFLLFQAGIIAGYKHMVRE